MKIQSEYKQFVGLPDGSEYISEDITIEIKEFEKIGQNLAQKFIDKGAKRVIRKSRKISF